ncbi:MAG: FlgD immunoglobulin-like domain containing protein, partial [Gemmatimonadales bacterium]
YMQSADFGGADCDNYTFVGTAGTTVWLNGRVTQTFPPSESRPANLNSGIYCGEDTTALVRIGSLLAIEARGGPVPPLIYTLPATGRYYIKLYCPGFYSTSYALSLRELGPAPGQAAQDHRDVVLVSSGDGGVTWSAKRRVNDSPPRFDDALPRVVVDGNGRVHVAWYDRRDDPDCGDRVHTYWTFSTDGGVSFVPSLRLSSASGSWQPFNGAAPNIGDHLGLAADGDRVHVLWTDTRGADADIYGTTITDLPTGIAVPRFEAAPSGTGVTLWWTVEDAAGITGFRVHRGEGESGGDSPLGTGPRATAGAGEYQEEDPGAEPGHTYRYRLEVLRGSAASEWHGPVVVSLPATIARLAWGGIKPNPFTGSILLELAVPRRGGLEARVYDLAGKEVITLRQGAVEAGIAPLTWDGRDHTGRRMPAGVYLVRADLGGERVTARIARIE